MIEGTWGGTAGDGLVNLIDTRDVADVARVALLDERASASQKAYHLTGPAPMSMPEIASELSHLLGYEVLYRHRTVAEQRAILKGSGLGDMVADLLLGLDRIFREGALGETKGTVGALTGEAPRSVAGWLKENLFTFTSGMESKA